MTIPNPEPIAPNSSISSVEVRLSKVPLCVQRITRNDAMGNWDYIHLWQITVGQEKEVVWRVNIILFKLLMREVGLESDEGTEVKEEIL